MSELTEAESSSNLVYRRQEDSKQWQRQLLVPRATAKLPMSPTHARAKVDGRLEELSEISIQDKVCARRGKYRPFIGPFEKVAGHEDQLTTLIPSRLAHGLGSSHLFTRKCRPPEAQRVGLFVTLVYCH
jgi:hypothetical protein